MQRQKEKHPIRIGLVAFALDTNGLRPERETRKSKAASWAWALGGEETRELDSKSGHHVCELEAWAFSRCIQCMIRLRWGLFPRGYQAVAGR